MAMWKWLENNSSTVANFFFQTKPVKVIEVNSYAVHQVSYLLGLLLLDSNDNRQVMCFQCFDAVEWVTGRTSSL